MSQSQFAFSEVNPEVVTAFLSRRGWHEDRRLNEMGARWRRSADDVPLLVPYHADVDDYEERLAEIVLRVAQDEGRIPSLVAQELTHGAFDLLHVRIPTGAGDYSVSLEAGTRLFSAARDMVAAAALSVASSTPQPVFGRGRRPKQALDFLDRMRLEPPTEGSFVVTLAAPVESDVDAETGEQEVGPPFGRRALLTLSRALETALRLAAEGPDALASADAVSAGVNANLLTAVATIVGDVETDGAAEFQFAWTPVLPSPLPPRQDLAVPKSSRAAFLEAAGLLRARAPLFDAVIEGRVMALAKTGPGYGVATVESVIQNAVRPVDVVLDEGPYDAAIAAHRDDLFVRVAGDIHRTGQRWRVPEVIEFEVLARDTPPPQVPEAAS